MKHKRSPSGTRGSIGSANALDIPAEVDVIVVGSGASGMAAALSAASRGARVLVLESEHLVGGTSAISGGAIWVPNHNYSYKALGTTDSREDGRIYLMGEGRDEELDPEIIDAFLDRSPEIARFIEKYTGLRWIPVAWPDYTSDIRGASNFRALFPAPWAPDGLGEAASLVRPPKKSGMARNPLPLWLMNGIQSVWLGGYALIGAYLEALLANGVDIRTETRVKRLLHDVDGVTGVEVDTAKGAVHVRARRGVILASGGFESSQDLTSKYLGGEFPTQVSVKGHDGDAVQMVTEVGADLVGMDQAWWMPGIAVPGEELDGTPISRLVQGERALPHTIMVNRNGERFANEAASYNDLGAIMREADPETGEMLNQTAWMVFDEEYHQRYSFLGTPPGGEYPPVVESAPTLEALAAKCGIDPQGLAKTVREYNPEAAKGRDPWFGRGTTTFERFFGDHNPFLGRLSWNHWSPSLAERSRLALAKIVGPIAGFVMAFFSKSGQGNLMRRLLVRPLAMIMKPALKNPATGALGPVDKPPYYAVKVEASAIGTLGGPRTDAKGRVLDVEGVAIPGLYAAGNVGGATTLGFYGGAGGTIVLGVVFGHLAGEDAAQRIA
jgi:3-oxosteroid 1-dehydrogenase